MRQAPFVNVFFALCLLRVSNVSFGPTSRNSVFPTCIFVAEPVSRDGAAGPANAIKRM
ncbi:MAG: hypothetical protein AVDCRST_MAG68-1079 [uncultured Gemmatimonadetes bacterium]|uniref:Uncharacterized protein n=1 Tax=uncultured Gemmatimonadota bacterium TaxID=203437 RepID=A0A6J4KIZ1_9BACT|nr:MAG: hypothetical protein AVDCRST_MAG68-1079 [uncultured Gemmatimonadota bacterium]